MLHQELPQIDTGPLGGWGSWLEAVLQTSARIGEVLFPLVGAADGSLWVTPTTTPLPTWPLESVYSLLVAS